MQIRILYGDICPGLNAFTKITKFTNVCCGLLKSAKIAKKFAKVQKIPNVIRGLDENCKGTKKCDPHRDVDEKCEFYDLVEYCEKS